MRARIILKQGIFTLTILSMIASFFVIPVKITKAAEEEPTLDYAVSYGGSGPLWYYAEATANAIDASGNLYTGGYFEETIDFDPGVGTEILDTCEFCADLYIQKLDNDGALLWVSQFVGNTTGSWLNEIALDSNANVYATGVFSGIMDFDPGVGTANLDDTNGDQFVVKLDTDGNFVWVKQMNSTSMVEVYSIVFDSTNNMYLSGEFRGTFDADLGAGVNNLTTAGAEDDGFILKLDSNGDFDWAQRYGSNGNDAIYDLNIDGNGDLVITGNFAGSIDFDLGAGTTTLVGSGADKFLLKLDSDGNFIWVKGMFSTSTVVPHYVRIDHSDNIITTGRFFGDMDFDPDSGTRTLTGNSTPYVAKYNSNGNLVWAGSYGSSTSPVGAVRLDSKGDIYSWGRISAVNDFDPGSGTVNIDPTNGAAYLLKINSDGEYEWTQQFTAGSSWAYAVDLVIDSDDVIYATGGFEGTGDFDPSGGTYNMTALDENGNGEPFVIKLVGSALTSVTFTSTADFSNNYVVGPDLVAGTADDFSSGTATTLGNTNVTGNKANLRALEFLSAKAGDYYTNAGIKADGTLWSAGDSFHFGGDEVDQLCQNSAYPYLDELTQVGTDSDWVYFNAGFDTLHMIKSDGTLWGCGEAQGGQLGDGTTVPKDVPTQIGTDTDWEGVWGADWHTIGKKTDGTLWAWGADWCGNLGQGTEDVQVNSPVQIGTDTDWDLVAAGDTHNLATKTDGTLWSWGCDYTPGELGLGNNPDYSISVPTQIGTDTDWAFVAAGFLMSAAIKDDGTLWTFGEGYGLGHGDYNPRNVPTQVGTDTDWVEVSVGFYHFLGQKSDGTIWGWGQGDGGVFGLGHQLDQSVPVQIGTDTDWDTISAAESWSMATKNDGSMWVAGANYDGQLALGDLVDRYFFTEVYFPPYYTTSALSGMKVYAGAGNTADWSDMAWSTTAIPAGTEVRFRVRTSDDNVTYSAWSSYFTQDVDGSTSGTADLSSITDAAYLEMEMSFTTTNDLVTPELLNFTVNYDPNAGGPPATAPTVTTAAASAITETTATLNGEITATGSQAPTTRGFEYGTTLAYGTTASTAGSFGTGVFNEAITGLTCNTLYHFRAFATSPDGTGNGSDATFTTSACPPGGGGGSTSSGSGSSTDDAPSDPTPAPGETPGINPGTPTPGVTPPTILPTLTPCQQETIDARAAYRIDIAANTAAYNEAVLAARVVRDQTKAEANSALASANASALATRDAATATYNQTIAQLRTTRDQAKAASRTAYNEANASALATLRAAQALDDQTRKDAAATRTATKADVNAVYAASTKLASDTKRAADTQADTDYNNGVVNAKQIQTAGYAEAERIYQESTASALATYNQALAAAGNNSSMRTQARTAYSNAINQAKNVRTASRSAVLATYNQTITDLRDARTQVKATNKVAYDSAIAAAKETRTTGLANADSVYNQVVADSRAKRAEANTVYTTQTTVNRQTLNTNIAAADSTYNAGVTTAQGIRNTANQTYSSALTTNRQTRDSAHIAANNGYSAVVAQAASARTAANTEALAVRDARIAAVCNPTPPAPVVPLPTTPPSTPTTPTEPGQTPGINPGTAGNGGSTSGEDSGDGTGIISIFETVLVDIRNFVSETSDTAIRTVAENQTAVATVSLTNLALLTLLQPLTIYSSAPGGIKAVSGASNYSLFYQRYALNLFSFLGLRKKRRVWGTVYDSETKQPLDPAVVELIDANTGEVKERAITDLAGRFGFLTTSGKFVLRASKTNYSFPSKTRQSDKDEFYDHLYHGEEFEIKDGSTLVTPNIPMDPVAFDWNQEAKKGLIARYSSLRYGFHILLTVLFWVGFAYAIFSYAMVPDTKNLVLLALYGLALIIRLLVGPKRLWGRLTRDGKPLAGARIELAEHQMGVIMGKASTASDGKFFLKTPQPGSYKLTVKSSPDGPVIYTKEVSVGKENVYTENLDLQNNLVHVANLDS